MPDRQPTRAHKRLAAELARLRRMEGLTVLQLVNTIGKERISRATVFRIDAAESIPSIPVVRAWLDATHAGDDTRRNVLALAEAVHTETVPWHGLLAGRKHTQDEVGEREQESVLVRNFQPSVIPGLLQAADYTRRLIELQDPAGQMDPEQVAAARQRRQEILHQPGREFRFIVAEHVLRWSPDAGVMAAQREHLLRVVDLPTVHLAVLPTAAEVRLPLSNFVLHERGDGSGYVTIELSHGTQRLETDQAMDLYDSLWSELWPASVSGDQALELIHDRT